MGSEKAISYTFHGTKRACRVGENNAALELCKKDSCAVCSIMRTSFQLKYAGKYSINYYAPYMDEDCS